MARWAAWGIIGVVLVAVITIVVASVIQPRGDPGLLVEAESEWPAERVLPAFVDITQEWGLEGWENTSRGQLSGGIGAADLDGDGLIDLVAAGGDEAVYFNEGDRFARASGAIAGIPEDAISVGLADLDHDTHIDMMIGTLSGGRLSFGEAGGPEPAICRIRWFRDSRVGPRPPASSSYRGTARNYSISFVLPTEDHGPPPTSSFARSNPANFEPRLSPTPADVRWRPKSSTSTAMAFRTSG
jgi:hypothetical protein